ncbi:MAG TPA: AAA family ATPase [Steroidobacteraceae bacterium]|nr:AAA family ATPase [Steroidobacteraceae bacterium]
MPGIDVTDLLDPACFPHPVSHLQLRETAISWVLLTGPYAYKIKKPLHLEFIDAATLPRRRFLCDEELRLNRRFAPELYRDVVPIGREHGRPRIDAAGAAAEYAVRMLQFDSSQELASLLAQDRVGAAELCAFGARLAQWHQEAAAASADTGYGSPALVRAQALENFPPLRRWAGADTGSGGRGGPGPDPTAILQQLEHWTVEFLARLEPLLQRRQLGGRVRECHGDLHSGNVVCWRAELLPFDCVEFEPRLRWIDAISDVAFLFMDLLAHARADLAYAFVSAYLEHGGDYEGLQLLRFYGVYRALVRAKVDALALAGHTGAPAQAHRQHLQARLHAAAQLASPQPPALVLMHGVSASGKSWISQRLIGALPAVRVRSDLERKRLPPQSRPGSAQRYSAAATQATYARLLDCAAMALGDGHNVVVDATFLDRAQRRRFEAMAEQLGRAWLIVACNASRATLLERLARRARGAADPSEATAQVLDRQLRALQPLEPSEQAATVPVDMEASASIETAIHSVQQRLLQPHPPSVPV